MIEDWLKYEEQNDTGYVFKLIHHTENLIFINSILMKQQQKMKYETM